MDITTRVNELANAYRATLAEGDRRFAQRPAEQKILHAVVAASDADAARWVETRVADGTDVAAPLKALLSALEHGNWVGKGLDWAKDQAFKQARAAVVAAFTQGALPVWLTSAAAFVVGFALWIFDVGNAVGAALIPTLLTATGAVWIAIARIAQASPQVMNEVGGAAGSLLSKADSVGRDAERLFVETSGPALSALYGQPAPPVPSVSAIVRGAARSVVTAAYTAFAVAVAVFLLGVGSGVMDWYDENKCRYDPALLECQQLPTFP